MTPDEFDFIIDSQLNVCRDVLGSKAREYAGPVDRLHNFKQAAHLQEVSVKEALRGMMAKHTVSIYDMINTGKTYSMEMWGEKITDHINYLLLLMAVVCEEDTSDPESFADEEVLDMFKELFRNLITSIAKQKDEANA